MTSKRRGGGRQTSCRLRLDLLMPGPGEVAAARIVVLAIANGGGFDEVLAALQAAIGRRQLDPRVQAALKRAFDGLLHDSRIGATRPPAAPQRREPAGAGAAMPVPRDGDTATPPAADQIAETATSAGGAVSGVAAAEISVNSTTQTVQQQSEAAHQLHAADGGQVHLTSRPFKPRRMPTEY